MFFTSLIVKYLVVLFFLDKKYGSKADCWVNCVKWIICLMDELKILRHNRANEDVKLLLLIFSVLSLSAQAETSVMAKCEQKFIIDEVSDVRSYLVLRDGDRLFSKYRESKLSEFTVLDDVTIRKYEGVRLEEFLDREENQELVDSLETRALE